MIEVPAALAALASPRGTLLGAGAASTDVLTPTSPVATAVTSPTPVFAWTVVKGATAYDVAVFDEQFNEVASAKGLTASTWTPTTGLPRGVTLSWQITAHVGDRRVLSPVPPQPEARFLVIAAALDAAVDADRRRLAGEPLALAVLLAERGLYADALAELRRVPDAAAAATLRAAIQARQGR